MNVPNIVVYVATLIVVVSGASLSRIESFPVAKGFAVVVLAAIAVAFVVGLQWRKAILASVPTALSVINIDEAVDGVLRARAPLMQIARQLASERVSNLADSDANSYLSRRFLSAKGAVVGVFSLGIAWLVLSGSMDLYQGLLALPQSADYGRPIVIGACLYLALSFFSFFFLGLTAKLYSSF